MVQGNVVHWRSDRGISAANVQPARPLCPPVPSEGARRLFGREEQATAQGFAPAFANVDRLAREAGLRVRPRWHMQPVCSGRAQRWATNRLGRRATRKG